MRLDPTVVVECDSEDCGESEEFGLTALAANCWDMRALTSQVRSRGWEEDGDRHTCPGCVEEREERNQGVSA